MRSKSLIFIIALLLSTLSYAGMTTVSYTVENISGNQWMYHYTISNLTFTEGIEEFTIWFDHGKYTDLSNNSDTSLAANWDQIVWQPNDALQNNGGFDALALSDPIAVGESVSGFAVAFTWNGTDEPGRQYYEIVNPDNPSEVFDSGYTSPEPSTILLLISSSVWFALKKKNV